MSMTHIYSELNAAVLRLALVHVATSNYKELADLGLTTEIIDELREFRAEDFVMVFDPRPLPTERCDRSTADLASSPSNKGSPTRGGNDPRVCSLAGAQKAHARSVRHFGR